MPKTEGKVDALISLCVCTGSSTQVQYANGLLFKLSLVNYRHETQISNFNKIHMSDQNCLTKYESNPSISRTGPNGQNIPDQGDLLINEEKAFCERQYIYVLRQKIR